MFFEKLLTLSMADRVLGLGLGLAEDWWFLLGLGLGQKNHSSVCLGLGQKSQCPSSASAYFEDITEDLTEDIFKIYTIEHWNPIEI